MKFKNIPVLSFIEDLYNEPISSERFKTYISKLQGETKGDLDLPIGGFNPMAKEHVLQKIKELKNINAEKLIKEVTENLNTKYENQNSEVIKIVLNLADDLKGGWTNRYTTDFDSKFKLNALVTRKFCTPYFWTSENYNAAIIKQRTLEYVYRTIFWLNNSKIQTLEDYVNQEIFVKQRTTSIIQIDKDKKYDFIKVFYEEHKEKGDYSILFNFFYGDHASASLNYPQYGIKDVNGFEYAEMLASKIKTNI